MARQRLDQRVQALGLTQSREQAKRLIMAGEVLVNGQVVDRPAAAVPDAARIEIKARPRFASRGGEKLDAALEHFQIEVSGLVCADVGASTGGFTDCLLQRGAARVYAIDVGHVEALKYGTRAGARTAAEWQGFAEVQAVAGQLNRLVADAARAAGLPIVNFPPSASTICRDGVIHSFAYQPIQAALEHNLIPLVLGDVAIDEARGGTIVSTEDVFRYLAVRLQPDRILLAGIEPGVLTGWPAGEVVPEITAQSRPESLGGSHAADVTGGMASKVREMLALAADMPGLEIRIFSGESPALVRAALLGEAIPGTVVRHV